MIEGRARCCRDAARPPYEQVTCLSGDALKLLPCATVERVTGLLAKIDERPECTYWDTASLTDRDRFDLTRANQLIQLGAAQAQHVARLSDSDQQLALSPWIAGGPHGLTVHRR